MMNDKVRKRDAAPQGAVEVDERELDKAAGGLNFTRPTESLSINYIGLESDEQDTQDLAAGGGPHVAPEKKI